MVIVSSHSTLAHHGSLGVRAHVHVCCCRVVSGRWLLRCVAHSRYVGCFNVLSVAGGCSELWLQPWLAAREHVLHDLSHKACRGTYGSHMPCVRSMLTGAKACPA